MPGKKSTTQKFGMRCGVSIRQKYGEIENKQRKKQICPFCKKTAKRLASGIYKCKKCGRKFASGAYYVD